MPAPESLTLETPSKSTLPADTDKPEKLLLAWSFNIAMAKLTLLAARATEAVPKRIAKFSPASKVPDMRRTWPSSSTTLRADTCDIATVPDSDNTDPTAISTSATTLSISPRVPSKSSAMDPAEVATVSARTPAKSITERLSLLPRRPRPWFISTAMLLAFRVTPAAARPNDDKSTAAALVRSAIQLRLSAALALLGRINAKPRFKPWTPAPRRSADKLVPPISSPSSARDAPSTMACMVCRLTETEPLALSVPATSMVAVAPKLNADPAKLSVDTGAADQLMVVVLATPCLLPMPMLLAKLTALPCSVTP